MTLDDIIDEILRRESSRYTNHPADAGGPTKYGVTLRTLAAWRNAPVTAEDVMALQEPEARDIYRHVYAIRPGLVKLTNAAVLGLAVDCAVNHGVTRAVKLVQNAAHVLEDGVFGPKTEAAANRMVPAALYRRICAARVRLYGEIITRDPSQAVFAHGWLRRASEFIEAAP